MSHETGLDRLRTISLRTRRALLIILALSAADVGIWAELSPHNWYTSFPGLGMHWLPVLGPYNEHLSRDVGGLYLGLLALNLGAIWRARDSYVARLTAATWTVFSVPHLIFHLVHLDMYNPRDQILNVVFLGGTLLIAATLLLAPHRTVER